MRKKILMGVICGAILTVSGCGKKIAELENGQDAVIKYKNGEMVSVDTLYAELKKSTALTTLLDMFDKTILEDKFKDGIEDAKKDAAASIESIKAQFGENALQALQLYSGFTNFEDYENYSYTKNLQNMQSEAYAKAQITDKQIETHYNEKIVGDIKVSHILIAPAVKDDMSTAEKTAAEEAAKTEAEAIITTLNETDSEKIAEKFAELAKAQSDDTATASKGGDMNYINKTTLGTTYGDFADKAYALKKGAYTKSVVKTELGYHIILKVEEKEKPALETVKESIVQTLAEELLTADARVAVEAMREIRKEYELEFTDTELKEQYTSYIQALLYQADEKNKQNTTAQ